MERRLRALMSCALAGPHKHHGFREPFCTTGFRQASLTVPPSNVLPHADPGKKSISQPPLGQWVKWKSPAISKPGAFPGVFSTAWSTYRAGNGGTIRLALGQHRPSNASQLVGDSYDQNVTVRSDFQLVHPLADCVVVSIQTHNNRARTMDEQSPQI